MRTVAATLVLLVLAAIPSALSAADVTGHWAGQMTVGIGTAAVPFVLDLKTDGVTLTGTFCLRDCTVNRPQSIQNPHIDGKGIDFTVTAIGSDPPQIDFHGLIDGDTVDFIVSGKAPQCLGYSCQVGDATAKRTK